MIEIKVLNLGLYFFGIREICLHIIYRGDCVKVYYIPTKTIYIILSLLVISIGILAILNNNFNKAEEIYLPITNRVIAIDPGHGGVDPGAVSKSGITEDEINLKIALKLKRFIEQSGGIPILTREEDVGLYTEKSTTLNQKKVEDLHNRRKLVEASGAEIFVSIHLNSFTQSKYFGAQIFYSETHEENQKLAIILQEELKNVLDKENTRQPAIREDVYVIKDIKIPSVLVEAGFLSNESEVKLLNTSEYQEKIAWSIYVGIMKYFNQE